MFPDLLNRRIDNWILIFLPLTYNLNKKSRRQYLACCKDLKIFLAPLCSCSGLVCKHSSYHPVFVRRGKEEPRLSIVFDSQSQLN